LSGALAAASEAGVDGGALEGQDAEDALVDAVEGLAAHETLPLVSEWVCVSLTLPISPRQSDSGMT
jgi:hypothetical protein